MMYTKRWGPAINNRLGWVLMEAPVFVVMLLLWAFSQRRAETAPVVMFLLCELHYFQHSTAGYVMAAVAGLSEIAYYAVAVYVYVHAGEEYGCACDKLP